MEANNSQSLSSVVASGDDLASLERIRDSITRDLENCDSMRDKAALYTRLTDVLTQIRGLRPPEAKGDVVDEIAARRGARRAGGGTTTPRANRSG